MEKASFVFVIMVVFKLVFFSSPISNTRENNAVFLILSVCVVHNSTARRSNFKENGNLRLWYTSLIKSYA